MKATKAPSITASKSTVLTNATTTKVSTLNPDFIMKSDNSINPTPAVNSTTPANADNLFDNEQAVIYTGIFTQIELISGFAFTINVAATNHLTIQ